MGAAKFVDTAWDLGRITLEQESDDPEEMTAKRVVDAYRNKFWRVKAMWGEQERAAIKAVQIGSVVKAGYVTWYTDDRFLYCELPSGRRLAYAEPLVKEKETPWGELRPQLTFMGVHPMSKKWVRQSTYGGSLVENITQAVARDIMAHAMLECERGGVYSIILSVHDELVSEAETGAGSVHEFEKILTSTPPWAEGCPIAAEGWRGYRYHK
jgi:DNA polymerase